LIAGKLAVSDKQYLGYRPRMTSLLESAMKKIAALPEDEQDSLAFFILAELESEGRWDSLFASSAEMLAKMAQDAVAELAQSETELRRSSRS
jgi:hypothetical protein